MRWNVDVANGSGSTEIRVIADSLESAIATASNYGEPVRAACEETGTEIAFW